MSKGYEQFNSIRQTSPTLKTPCLDFVLILSLQFTLTNPHSLSPLRLHFGLTLASSLRLLLFSLSRPNFADTLTTSLNPLPFLIHPHVSTLPWPWLILTRWGPQHRYITTTYLYENESMLVWTLYNSRPVDRLEQNLTHILLDIRHVNSSFQFININHLSFSILHPREVRGWGAKLYSPHTNGRAS